MTTLRFVSIVTLTTLSLLTTGCGSNEPLPTSPNNIGTLHQENGLAAGKILVVGLQGTYTAETRPIPVTDQGSTEAACFDLDLINLSTGKVIGTATDCLSDISDVGDGMALTGTTIFNLPGGTIMSRGRTTVKPITTNAADTPVTHITGAVPNAGTNSIISGTGKYAGASGEVRLSGAVNLSAFPTITFDCIFVITLD